MYSIILHLGQLPVDVAGLHLQPGRPVRVDEVPPEVEALRLRVRMDIRQVRGLPVVEDDGPALLCGHDHRVTDVR